jgi:dipeptidyl aminopeptidase/acylaminoacyl peptidase
LNYFIDQQGVAIIFPNVRGSTGYGKTFVAADNGGAAHRRRNWSEPVDVVRS